MKLRRPPSRTDSAEDPLEVLDRVFAPIADVPQEVAVFAYLDPKWSILGMRHVAAGGWDRLVVPLRTVVADVLAFDAAAVAMAHNHPSGDPTPSGADYRVTQRIAQTLDAIGVQLVDHVVLARGARVHFRARGFL